MVSIWPWKRADDSPASFEKVLSALATKIANTQAKLDRTRSSSRRARVLSTLYLTFGYLVYAIVLALVVGWKNMGRWEWSGVAGGPVLIYATRKALASVFSIRIDSLASTLKQQQEERAKTIQKLKDATKYDSTLQLLEKYGGGGETKPCKGNGEGKAQQSDKRGKGGPGGPGGGAQDERNRSTPNRTRLPPPPTANIPSGSHVPAASLASSKPNSPRAGAGGHTPGVTDLSATAEFAPNAFGPDEVQVQVQVPAQTRPPDVAGGPYAHAAAASSSGAAAVGESHWYDRLLDLLMGDDETAAKNRFVLICRACRLVNGQAPPGTHSLADVGRWRCMGCGALNGEDGEDGEDGEAAKIVSQVLQRTVTEVADSEAESEDDEVDEVDEVVEVEIQPESVNAEDEEVDLVATGKDNADRKSVRKRSKKTK
ncbi:hypothetical protein SPBR_09205 [Sporothrix brasiliensis 5110]|uniref:Endoplasmic reticulum junction formation protein lunapark n=1 Tax=Sporothrix brasiliensis 5110 TaxID=1398154 RepID=A0A0C2IYA5_9PEZI|nr:uncharacterized protein SPBR_09205 [Sporothrix brasiliensis 5110]KIH94071.1 hypothetical protein SPBR_09205 [Sporothrix brasiliensis 5110]